MNKYLIILGLEKLLEQVKDSKELMYKSDYNKRIKEINEQIDLMKELDINFSTFKKYEKYNNK
tara:strand:- start:52 stop:240 length:189 start_codon:yes stop_codon:yes gene_type:complete